MNCDYVRNYYKVPAELGRRVRIDGKEGVIAEDRGAYIGVVMDGCKATDIRPYHPTWKVEYLGMGTIPKLTRSQQRYRRYREYGECFNTFIEFCRWDAAPERSWNGGA